MAGYDAVIRAALAWTRELEAGALRYGAPLDADGLMLARDAGVQRPEKVRVVRTAKIKTPDSLAAAAENCLGGREFDGLTCGYAVLVTSGDRKLLGHELKHVSQCERLGGRAPVVKAYVIECLANGYLGSALEKEAIEFAKTL